MTSPVGKVNFVSFATFSNFLPIYNFCVETCCTKILVFGNVFQLPFHHHISYCDPYYRPLVLTSLPTQIKLLCTQPTDSLQIRFSDSFNASNLSPLLNRTPIMNNCCVIQLPYFSPSSHYCLFSDLRKIQTRTGTRYHQNSFLKYFHRFSHFILSNFFD